MVCVVRTFVCVASLATITLFAGCGDVEGPAAPDSTRDPDYHGRIVAHDGGAPGVSLRLTFRSGSREDVVSASPDGTFAGMANGVVGPSVVVEIADPSRRYLPSRFEVDASRLSGALGVIVVPRSWPLATPHYDGSTTIDLPAAFGYPGVDTGLYSWWRIRGARQEAETIGWDRALFPLPIHLQPDALLPFRGSSPADTVWLQQVRLTGSDEQLFWSSIQAMEDRFGIDLFRPATPADLTDTVRTVVVDGEVVQSTHPHVVGVSIVEGLSEGIGLSGAAGAEVWSAQHDAYCEPNTYCFGLMLLTDGAIGAKRTVAHELMHALGFGHACLPSVLFKKQCERGGFPFVPLPSSVQPGASGTYQRITEYDVALAELVWDVHETQLRTGYRFGLWEAFQGVRVEMGLPPVHRCWEDDGACGTLTTTTEPESLVRGAWTNHP